MAISYIDTSKVSEIADNIKKLTSDLEDQIESLFSRLDGVPIRTMEWIGNQSTYYFQNVMQDKQQYISFSKKLEEISSRLNKDLVEINCCLNKNKDLEMDK